MGTKRNMERTGPNLDQTRKVDFDALTKSVTVVVAE